MNQSNINKEKCYRFDEIRKELGLSQKAMAEIVGANQGNYSSVMSGKRNLPDVWTYRLKEKYVQVNDMWVLSGEGEMFLTSKNEGPFLSEPDSGYGNAKELTKKELEKLVLHLSYRVTVLEEWKKDMEEWKREAISMVERGKKK